MKVYALTLSDKKKDYNRLDIVIGYIYSFSGESSYFIGIEGQQEIVFPEAKLSTFVGFGKASSGTIDPDNAADYEKELAEILKQKIEETLRRELWNEVKEWYDYYKVKCPYKTASSFIEKECGWALDFNTDSLAEVMDKRGSHSFVNLATYSGFHNLNFLEEEAGAVK